MSNNMQVIEDECSCGEAISVELNCQQRVLRTDKKRPFYHDELLPTGLNPEIYDVNSVSVFRCRKCHGCIDETVPAAARGEA